MQILIMDFQQETERQDSPNLSTEHSIIIDFHRETITKLWDVSISIIWDQMNFIFHLWYQEQVLLGLF